jgi:hypothetical protein
MFAKYKKSKAKPYPPSADATLIQWLKPLAFPSLCRNMVFDGRRTPIPDTNIENEIRAELKKRPPIKQLIFITKAAGVLEIKPRA